jgi:predicted metal-dependent peptidase
LAKQHLPDEKQLKFSKERIEKAWMILRKHALIGPLVHRARLKIIDYAPQVSAMFTTVASNGEVIANPFNLPRTTDEWVFVLAHSLLHLAFGHTKHIQRGFVWNVACDCVVNEFLARMKIGTAPEGTLRLPGGMPNDEEKLFQIWASNATPPKGATTSGAAADMVWAGPGKANWADIFARAVRRAARESLAAAAGDTQELGPAHQARAWFVKNYPLLGAVAQHFKIIEDAKLCERLQVRIAAVNPRKRELILNPGWAMDDKELRYIVAHMALHAGLMHAARGRGRDQFVWSVACDYCINDYLADIAPLKSACAPPKEGLLHSPLHHGKSPEDIYDTLLENPRSTRKLVTFAGESLPDLLGVEAAGEKAAASDRFFLDALLRGYQIHAESGRGALPHRLIDELRALEQPPLAWDVVLARWFDQHVPPVERIRTYGRPSRRQSATPEIARPRYIWPDEEIVQRSTFGLVIDASGALPQSRLSEVLGAIGAYALSRNISRVRIVFSGSEVRDLGPIAADDIPAQRVPLPRSTPSLGPGVRAMEESRDFPSDAPLLIVSGMPPDRATTPRTHAWLIPEGSRLPFKTEADVIRF